MSFLFLIMLISPVRSWAGHRKHHASVHRAGSQAVVHGRTAVGERRFARTRRHLAALRWGTAVKDAENPARPAVGVDAGEEANGEYVEYRVKRGDTVDKLARMFNIDREEIIDLNSVGTRRLRPGMTVFIPKTTKEDTQDEPTVVLNDGPLKPWKSEEERGILVKVAKSFAGAPYRYGGESVRGLDCSAFVRKMYGIFEVELPRSAREQFFAGPRVNSKEELVTGDLVFFRTKPFAHYPTHVGIYIGEDRFIHASSLLRRGVKVDCLTDSYFARTYMGAVRVKAPPVGGDRPDLDHEDQHKAANNS